MLSINTPKQLLEKAKYSNNKISTTYSNPEYDYLLFDTIFTLNHLFEWYLKDKNISTKEKLVCINKFNPFQNPYDVSPDFKDQYKKLTAFPSVNNLQLNIRLLCNKGKHFKNQKIEKDEKTYTAVAGLPTMVCGGTCAVAGRYMIKYVLEIAGQDINIEALINTLINDWENFF